MSGETTGPQRGGRSRWLRGVRNGAWILLLVLCGFAVGIYVGRGPSRTSKLADLGTAPSYTLRNQWDKSVSSQSFAGKIQIVTFLFPYCTSYCPLITAHLIGFERLLAASGLRDKIAIVAFNVAPGATGPKQMRAFLSQYGWDPHNPHWQYLTGTPAQIRKVVTGGFHIYFQRTSDTSAASGIESEPGQAPQLSVANPLAEKAKPGFDISHNDALVIVGPGGTIRKIYDDADVVSNDQLMSDVRALLSGQAGAATG